VWKGLDGSSNKDGKIVRQGRQRVHKHERAMYDESHFFWQAGGLAGLEGPAAPAVRLLQRLAHVGVHRTVGDPVCSKQGKEGSAGSVLCPSLCVFPLLTPFLCHP